MVVADRQNCLAGREMLPKEVGDSFQASSDVSGLKRQGCSPGVDPPGRI